MTDAERYAALRALYLRWYERTGDGVHLDLAAYCEARIAEAGKISLDSCAHLC